jgi:hypothetical protein
MTISYDVAIAMCLHIRYLTDTLFCILSQNESETRGWMEMALPPLLQHSTHLLRTFIDRLDGLVSLNESLKASLDKLEVQVSQAELALGSSSSSFRSMLNYFVSIHFCNRILVLTIEINIHHLCTSLLLF